MKESWTPLRRGRSRHVPAEVWRAVWERDGGRCAWPLENGGVCGSTWRIQLDHVDGFALGAGTTVHECRITCGCHNDVNARRLYGDDLMNRYTRPKRGPRCSEPVAAYAPIAVASPRAPLSRFVVRGAPPSRSPRAERRRASLSP